MERRQLVSVLRGCRDRGLIDADAEQSENGGYHGQRFRWRLTEAGTQHFDRVLAVVRSVRRRR